jgi:hypothetical protein
MMMGFPNISILSPASTISIFVVMAMVMAAVMVSMTLVLVCLVTIIIPASVRRGRSMLLPVAVSVSSLIGAMLMAMSVFPLNLSQSFLDLLLLFLDQIVSHRILIIFLSYSQ